MSFVVVALVYIMVFLCGEGLTSVQIRNDPTLDFDAVRRRWLRVLDSALLLMSAASLLYA
jgi:hypothetical protein